MKGFADDGVPDSHILHSAVIEGEILIDRLTDRDVVNNNVVNTTLSVYPQSIPVFRIGSVGVIADSNSNVLHENIVGRDA